MKSITPLIFALMNYQQTIDYLFDQLPMYQRVGAPAMKFGLDNTIALLKSIDDPHQKTKTVHVAGTNGKGSSAHMIASVLQEAGYTVGLHTSPHLRSFTERIRVDGREIDKVAVIDFVDRIKPNIDRIKPSFFEITFAMAMDYFFQQEVDIAIIEVGMGGRLDSTNVIEPVVSLITNISLDHQYFLGDTIAEIAEEKAGIIKETTPVIISETHPETEPSFRLRAKQLMAPIEFADQHYRIEKAADDRVNIIHDGAILLEGIKPDLPGNYQGRNLPGVIGVLRQLKQMGWLGVTDAAISKGLASVIRNTGIKGRWQVLGNSPLIIADTGHNEAGIKQIMEQLYMNDYEKLHIVWGMVSDKQVKDILDLLPVEATYYFVQADVPRAMKVTLLNELAIAVGLKGNIFATVQEGVEAARKAANKQDLIFIGGSTFVVAEIEGL